MVIAVSRWAEAESDGEEGSQGEGIGVDSSLTTVQSLQKSLVALITLINEGISLSSSSSGSSSGRKDKKSSTRRRSPPPVPMYQVLLLDGEEDEEDPFGAECTHLVCTLPPPPTSLPHHWLVLLSVSLSVWSVCLLPCQCVCEYVHSFTHIRLSIDS